MQDRSPTLGLVSLWLGVGFLGLLFDRCELLLLGMAGMGLIANALVEFFHLS